jgi:YegS/Rv2252/BmrU family lipid kinase
VAVELSHKPEASVDKRLMVIANPWALRRIDRRRLATALDWLEDRGWSVTRRLTERVLHARDIAQEAAVAGYNAVLASGGDGTINEVVNGLAGTNTALAVLPAGTINIWARETGISRDPVQAVRLLEFGSRRRVDLGRANERYFLMLASVGVDSDAVYRVSTEKKQRWGRYAYIAAAIAELVRNGSREITVSTSDSQRSGNAFAAVIGNTRLYGGMLRVTAKARIDDGLLDTCVYYGDRLGVLPIHIVRTLRERHVSAKNTHYVQAPEVRITSPRPMPVQADGEHVGFTPVTFVAVPAALTVVVPAGLRSPLFTRGRVETPTRDS